MFGFLSGLAIGLFVSCLAIIGLFDRYSPPIMPEDEAFFIGLTWLLAALATAALAALMAATVKMVRDERRRVQLQLESVSEPIDELI